MVGVQSEYPIITLVTVILSSVATWFFTRKKNTSQTTSIDLGNVSKTIQIYENAADELKKEADDLREKYAALLCKIADLTRKVNAVEAENKALRAQVNRRNKPKKTPPK